MSENYCAPSDAVALAVTADNATNLTEDDIQPQWLDDVDALIEQYTGQGYKGATRETTLIGTNGSLLKLPSKAGTIISIYEQGQLLSTGEYTLETGGRLLERQPNVSMAMFGYIPSAGKWYNRVKYVITYTEPVISQLPHVYRLAASHCVMTIALFAKKYAEFGVALSAYDAGNAGKVSSTASTTFPAALTEELRRTIQAVLRKPII